MDYASSPFLQAAGMTISPSLLEITGEVIQPPGLGFGNSQVSNDTSTPPAWVSNPSRNFSQTVPAEHGKWNMIRKQFFERAPNFTRLTIIDCSNSPDERLANLSRQFNNSFQAVGKCPCAAMIGTIVINAHITQEWVSLENMLFVNLFFF